MIYVTLQQIRDAGPCLGGWKSLLRGLNKKAADSELLTLGKIADVCGLPNALWSLQAVTDQEEKMRDLAFAAYQIIKPECSKSLVQWIDFIKKKWEQDSAFDFAADYDRTISIIESYASPVDWVAAVALHPDTAWAARCTSIRALNLHPESTSWFPAYSLVIRKML